MLLNSNSNIYPHIYISKQKIISNLESFCKSLNFKTQEIFYPIKVNNDCKIIKIIQNKDCRFEAASVNEIKILLKEDVNSSHIIYGNPIKSAEAIKMAFDLGIRIFAADSLNEIEKIATHAPKSKVILRLNVNNEGATWKLSEKFGCSNEEFIILYERALNKCLIPGALSFHVGWNNKSIETWEKVISDIDTFRKRLLCLGHSIKTIDIGGGFPAHDEDSEEFFKKISLKILPYLNIWREEGIKVWAEPGSYLLAKAGTLYSMVIEKLKRNNKTWIFLDTGIFQGFYWILGGITYKLINESKRNTKNAEEFIVSGPTSDSYDIFSRNAILPVNTEIGDIISITPAGAYIHSAKNYNGFEMPAQIVCS